ncbi:DUF1120 domain-containing protein [Serratia fonticola]|uniref:DUF1120 domain-containing protein n=1 Tax=Serratia fonticola TaxID=47917 RepID=UPI00141549E2|nr:DUF1120 domain-containing protein [Serratia fonticola]QIP94577.1 hypothetical protein HAP32_05205 [Serratia fonticola]
MKKNKLRTSLIGLLATASFSGVAAESFDISVIGTITPAACKATIAGGNTFDYGTILAGSLSQDDFTVLPEKTTGFSITCEAPAKMGIQTVDNRSGTKVNPVGKSLAGLVITETSAIMGLGTDPAGNKIGAYVAAIPDSSVRVDTADAAENIFSRDSGITWIKSTDNQTLFVNNSNIFSWTKVGEKTPLAFKVLNGEIKLQAAIAPASTLNLTQPIQLDGSATVQLYYL